MRDLSPLIIVAVFLTLAIFLGSRPYTIEIDGHKYICLHRAMTHHPDCPCEKAH